MPPSRHAVPGPALDVSEVLRSTPQRQDGRSACRDSQPTENCPFSSPPPLMHFPHCRLDICPLDFPSAAAGASVASKLERIALPGPLVRSLISHFEQQPRPQARTSSPTPSSTLPSTSSSASSSTSSSTSSSPSKQHLRIQPHIDDGDDWVYSRSLLADFTGFREDEAEALSSQGRLCCWASVVLQEQRPEEDAEGPGEEQPGGGRRSQSREPRRWELGFVVQRVGVRDPGSGWCECF